MGNCAPSTYQNSQRRGDQSDLILQNDRAWQKIRDAAFDQGNYYFVQEFQDIYTELYGAYLVPDRVAILLLEFKRFLYLVFKYHTSQQIMQNARDDPQMKHFPSPRLLASPIVDRMWKLLCSNTRLYRKFCQNNFGAFLDRDVQQSPPIEYYQATLKAYQTQFGAPNPSIWPSISSGFALSSAYNGFIFMPASSFILFHEYFVKKFPSQKIDQPELVYAKELIQLRQERMVKLQENKENGQVQFQTEVRVNASPESGQVPVKLAKNKALTQ